MKMNEMYETCSSLKEQKVKSKDYFELLYYEPVIGFCDHSDEPLVL